MQRRWPLQLGVLLVYGLLALALTYPLAAHLGSHVPGNGVDDPPLTWNLWWVPTALLELGTNPFQCDHIFYPLGINLSLYTLTVLNGLLSIPLQAVLPLVASSNLLLLSSFVLGGYGAYLLALAVVPRREGVAGHLPAFAAGLIYAFSSNKLFYAALGQWNIASSQWIPFYVLALVLVARRPGSPRLSLLAGLFLLFQAYAELTYASFLVLFTGLWLAWNLLLPPAGVSPGAPRRRHAARLALSTGLVALVFLAGIVPQLAAMLPDLRAEGDIWAQGGGFADIFSADLLGYFVPTALHPLLGGLGERLDFHRSVGQQVYPGYVVLGLAALGLAAWRRRPAARFWALSAAAFWLLTLGPSLQVNGRNTGLPLPFALVEQLPFFQGNRYPSRYSVMLTLSLALLAAMGLAWLAGRLAGKRGEGTPRARRRPAFGALLVALGAAFVFEHLSAPLPLSNMDVPPVYETLAREMPGDFTLLDLPLAWRNGSRVTGTQHPLIMFEQYYQSAHGKRLLAGNTSRNPSQKFQYFSEAPVIDSLIALETGHSLEPAAVEADAAIAPQVMRFFDVQAIVVHPGVVGPDVVPYLEAILPLETLYRDEETVAYRVGLPAWPERWTARADDPLGRLSFAEGWSPAAGDVAWAQRRTARLLVPSAGGQVRLSFRAFAPGPGQRLRVEAGGRQTVSLPLSPGWQDYALDLALSPGLNEVRLHFRELYPAAKARLPDASRGIGGTGVQSPVSLVVASAGQEVGDLAEIYVAGRDVSPGGRGYNLAVIDPASGTVQATANFDTHLDEGASAALAAFVAQVPRGQIVAVAAADEASRLLGDDAVQALRRLGAAGDLRDRFRWSHAFIGVQGAAPGTAFEALDWKRPVRVVAGEGATEPDLAAAFGPLNFAGLGPEP